LLQDKKKREVYKGKGGREKVLKNCNSRKAEDPKGRTSEIRGRPLCKHRNLVAQLEINFGKNAETRLKTDGFRGKGVTE